MEKKQILTRILAIGGTTLVWLPLLAPLVFALAMLGRREGFLFDYLMPAELLPVVLVGGGLLLLAAFWTHSRRALITACLGAGILMLFVGQGIAMVTGLATGEIEPTGWQWALVLTALGFYIACVAAVGVGGILLLRDLWRPGQHPAHS